jgi:SPP1 gp7 family putative phage head morphogenesis protein
VVKTSQEYWHDRIRERRKIVDKIEDGAISQVDDRWRLLQKSYRAEVSEFYDRYSKDGKISPDRANRPLTKRKREAIQNNIANTTINPKDLELSKFRKDLSKRKAISRLEGLEYDLSMQAHSTGQFEIDTTTGMLGVEGRTAYSLSIWQLEQALEGTFKYGRLSKRRLDAAIKAPWSGANYSDRIWTDKQLLTRNINEILTRGIIQGHSRKQMGAELSKRTGVELWKAERVMRTEGAHITEWAVGESYDAIGLERYEYSAILDSRTSQVCSSLDNKIFKVENRVVGVNYPPVHPNCRSTTIPAFKGQRIQVNTDGWRPQSYESWRAEN